MTDCSLYQGSLCSSVLSNTLIGINATDEISFIENKILSSISLFKNNGLLTILAPFCMDAFLKYQCLDLIPSCSEDHTGLAVSSSFNNNNISLRPCLDDVCFNVLDVCGPIMNHANIPHSVFNVTISDCSAIKPTNLSDSVLNSSNSSNSSNPIFCDKNSPANTKILNLNSTSLCPNPLLPIPNGYIPSSMSTCFHLPETPNIGCCLPCPSQNVFYPRTQIKTLITSSSIARIFSSLFAFIVILTYAILPNMQSHPRRLVLYLSLSIFIWQIGGAATLLNEERIHCADAITTASQSNNIKCAIQGGFVLFGSLAVTIWSFILILNFHMVRKKRL